MKILLVAFALLNLSFIHPLYVSVVSIKHNDAERNLEISIKAFVDDVEGALKQNYKMNFDLAKGENKPEYNKWVKAYVESKLGVMIDDKQKTLHYIGFEVQKESVWIFAEITAVENIKKLQVDCNWLYDFANKQSNIFNVTCNKKEKNYKLDNPKTEAEFTW